MGRTAEEGVQPRILEWLLSRSTSRRMDIKIRFFGDSRENLRCKGVRYFSNIHVAEFLMENDELHVGDEIVISGPTTGAIIMKVEEIRVDLKPVEKTVRGERFSIKVDERVRPSDKLYVWRDVEEVRRQRVIK